MSTIKKILIIGPIGGLGGREIEAGLINYFLKEKFDVRTFSTEKKYKNSSFYQVSPSLRNSLYSYRDVAKGLDQLKINLFEYFSSLNISRGRSFLKKILSINYLKKSLVFKEIEGIDSILFLGQTSSFLFEEIVRYSVSLNKDILFRPTGTISNNSFISIEVLNMIKMVVFHSMSAKNSFFKFIAKCNYTIIDQTSLLDNSVRSSKFRPIQEEHKVKFIIVSRLVKEKGIEDLIIALNKFSFSNWELSICGIGPEYKYLIDKYSNNINFYGNVSQFDLTKKYQSHDVLMLNSDDFETGPITGVEAMSFGLNILTNNCGAMEERDPGSFFMHDRSLESITNRIGNILSLSRTELNIRGQMNYEMFKDNYSKDVIREKYLKCFNA